MNQDEIDKSYIVFCAIRKIIRSAQISEKVSIVIICGVIGEILIDIENIDDVLEHMNDMIKDRIQYLKKYKVDSSRHDCEGHE